MRDGGDDTAPTPTVLVPCIGAPIASSVEPKEDAIDPRSGQLEILCDGECVKLLRSHDLGRVALVDREVRPPSFPAAVADRA